MYSNATLYDCTINLLNMATKLKNFENIQKKLEIITRKWWFFILIFLILGLLIVKGSWPIALNTLSPVTNDVRELFGEYSLSNYFPVLSLIFKIISVLIFISIIFFKNKIAQIFSIYVTISYILFALLGEMGFSKEYGLMIYPYPFILLLIIVPFWFLEIFVKKNDFTSKEKFQWKNLIIPCARKIPSLKYWVVFFAIYAFLYSFYEMVINYNSGNNFFTFFKLIPSPNLFESGFDFYTMAPLHLAVLAFYYPKVNIVTFRITSLIGMLISFSSGVHMILLSPLFIYCLALSYKKIPTEKTNRLSLLIIFIILLMSLFLIHSNFLLNRGYDDIISYVLTLSFFAVPVLACLYWFIELRNKKEKI